MDSRRGFIKKSFRMLGFTILAGGSTYLLFREQSAEACNFEFVCNSCKNLEGCSLPEAKDHKKNK